MPLVYKNIFMLICPLFYFLEPPWRCYDTKQDTLAFTKVDAFLPNKIYYQGCLKAFLQITKWNGPEVHLVHDFLSKLIIVCWTRWKLKDFNQFTQIIKLMGFGICLKLSINCTSLCQVIYFGDHLFSDLRGPSKAGWRTAAIIHELEVSHVSVSFQIDA